MTENAEDAWASAAEESRDTTNPDTPTGEEMTDLQTAIRDAYADIDAGHAHENLTIRDENLAALVAGLDNAGQLEATARHANDHLDRTPDESLGTRAAVLKALLRVGLDEVEPEIVETARKAKREHEVQKATDTATDF